MTIRAEMSWICHDLLGECHTAVACLSSLMISLLARIPLVLVRKWTWNGLVQYIFQSNLCFFVHFSIDFAPLKNEIMKVATRGRRLCAKLPTLPSKEVWTPKLCCDEREWDGIFSENPPKGGWKFYLKFVFSNDKRCDFHRLSSVPRDSAASYLLSARV